MTEALANPYGTKDALGCVNLAVAESAMVQPFSPQIKATMVSVLAYCSPVPMAAQRAVCYSRVARKSWQEHADACARALLNFNFSFRPPRCRDIGLSLEILTGYALDCLRRSASKRGWVRTGWKFSALCDGFCTALRATGTSLDSRCLSVGPLSEN